MAAKAAALRAGSFRHSFAEKKERLLSSQMGFSYAESIEEDPPRRRCCSCLDGVASFWRSLPDVARRAKKMGRSDPRKIIFSLKMGLALSLISLLIFLKEPFADLSRYSLWAILTVVVVFEFSIGATLSKGFNRGLGTLLAGGFALGMALLSELAGDWEEAFLIASIFIIGSLATYMKLYPTMKPYEYGFRVFLLTYCFVMVSGYRTRDFIHTAATRFMHIALGAAVGLLVNICIYPIWAGEDLHKLVVKNFMGVANSLEGCVNWYLSSAEYTRVPSLILTYQASDDPLYSGYRAAVESISQEDTLMGFATWEPPHGPYKSLKYPWKTYVKVSGALRHCAFMVMALHGCILAEIQAPAQKRRVFRKEIQRVGVEGAKVLRELGTKMKNMEKLGSEDILVEVQEAAEELQKKIDQKSYLFVNAECWEIGDQSKVGHVQNLIDFDDSEHKVLEYKSLSEAVLDLRSATLSQGLPHGNGAYENMFKKQVSLAPPSSVHDEAQPVLNGAESRTFESASALSLSTFTSLLIEFVARLQNLVDSYEELSEKAKFKEPHGVSSAEAEPVGFWIKLWKTLSG